MLFFEAAGTLHGVLMGSLAPWVESFGVAVVAVIGFLLGRWFSRLPKPVWLLGYFLPLAIVFLYCVAMLVPQLGAIPPVSWLMMGRARFASINFITTMLLSAPLTRLPQKRTRVVVCVLILALTSMAIIPFLAPAFNRGYLSTLQTRIDANGVCRQSNDYTCAPAAAVTALRKLGLPAEEGELALLAHTSSLTGTEPDVLAKVLQKRYAADGLRAEYRVFKDLDDLKRAGFTVAVLKFNALQDHCVTVLEVQTNTVLVADPLNGLNSMASQEFENQWLYVGIALTRSNTQTAVGGK